MICAHKICQNPTPEQAMYFAKAAGIARFVWNWALAEWNRQYEAGEKPTALKLKKQFNEIRREQFPWTWEVTKNASDQPFLDLGKAFTAFFEGKLLAAHVQEQKARANRASIWQTINLSGGPPRLDSQAGMGQYGREPAFQGKVAGARITKIADWRFISIPGRSRGSTPRQKKSSSRYRCWPELIGNLEYRRGIREPSIPQNGALKVASGE